MSTTEENCPYGKQRKFKRDPPPPEETYHNCMVVPTDYTVLTLTVWGEQYDHYKLLRKLRQVIRGHELQT